MIADGDKSWFGWPTDPQMEKLRDAYARETDPVQSRALETAQYGWLRMWYGPGAARSSVVGWLKAPVTVLLEHREEVTTNTIAGGAHSDVRAHDGTRLAVYEWGDPSGPEVVLIHGFAQSHLCFEPQLRGELVRHCRVVAYDQRGHGASAQPADPSAYQGSRVWADDIAAVLSAKGLRRPVLAGWSMGGRVIRQYLMVHGDARLAGVNFVASQVIEDASCRGPGAPKPMPENPTLAEEIEAAIAFLDGCYGRKPAEAEFRRALAYNMKVPAAVRRAIAGWSTEAAPTLAALAKVRVPVLITHGREDTVVLPAAAEMTLAAMPHARLSWFDGCGHSPFCEDAPRFNAELLSFVEACGSGTAARATHQAAGE